MKHFFLLLFSLLYGCQPTDVKSMEFPKKGIKEGPGLFSGEKGYFEVLGDLKKEATSNSPEDNRSSDLEYEASK